jgi:hypothetical protein
MTGQVGPRGLAILVLAGITGLLLAILGWSNRGTGLVAPSVGGLGVGSVTRQAGGISVVAGFTGESTPPAHFYAGGAMVYVIETALGDDSGHFGYNLGDDGLVVTNGQGQILT